MSDCFIYDAMSDSRREARRLRNERDLKIKNSPLYAEICYWERYYSDLVAESMDKGLGVLQKEALEKALLNTARHIKELKQSIL